MRTALPRPADSMHRSQYVEDHVVRFRPWLRQLQAHRAETMSYDLRTYPCCLRAPWREVGGATVPQRTRRLTQIGWRADGGSRTHHPDNLLWAVYLSAGSAPLLL
jgi:hypothetical protein